MINAKNAIIIIIIINLHKLFMYEHPNVKKFICVTCASHYNFFILDFSTLITLQIKIKIFHIHKNFQQ